MELIASGLTRRFLRHSGESNAFEAVRPADLTLRSGEMTVLTGRSGSGKTTLLTMLAGLLRPSGGSVTLDSRDLYRLSDAELSGLRAKHFAVIPQGASAISSLTVMENILFPTALAGKKPPVSEAEALMERLGILNLRNVMPGELSGGELRRMAVTRALAGSPDFVFADEPTADLDDGNTVLVLTLLREAAQNGASVFVVTHEKDAAAYADRLLHMDAGNLTNV
ncbi:MAG: ATP-binding cassette domain-containing protein [Clostridia bacterium]|nr:ATP-binding cassette domain-containing protein [Clostridia bacterium]